MKIFNWVHRRFHHKDGFGRYANKGECIENESETQALLKNVALADVINGWNEGILTIGTFGFDPKTENPPFISIINKENEQDYEDSAEEEGELNPLVVNNDDKFESHCDDENDQQGDLIMTIDGNVLCPYNKMEKGERITLADLFSADSDTNKIANPEDIGKLRPDSIKKPSPNSKDGASFTKKVKIPLVGDDPHLIQKIQRLMKRMKKRKIHPELEGKLEKKEGTTTTTATTTTTPTVLSCFKTHHGLNESASLLQTRDSMVCA